MELHMLDVRTAFLNGEIEENVYTTQPPGYEEGTSMVCHLHRTLYGLRQAPRAWHQRLKAELVKLGFRESQADPGLFIGEHKGQPTYILCYVDDLAIASATLDAVKAAKASLMKAFDARDLGDMTLFLGMGVVRDRSKHCIRLTQERMISDIIAKIGLDNAKTKPTPLSPSLQMTKDSGEPLDTALYPYGTLVGMLMYLSVCTRPDIAQSVGALARYMSAPKTDHWLAAKGVLRYLAGTPTHGLTFQGTSTTVLGYCDADYAGDLDTRRSTTGYVFIINGGAVSWSSRHQQTVAASTTEAEYMAAAHAAKEALWLRKLMADLRIGTGMIVIKADNQSAIKLLKNPITSLRSKHIDVIYHFARERVARGEIEYQYISTTHMIADALTKAVAPTKLILCRDNMGVLP
jgi:phosphopantetheinyl transferase (holo-ACP synthase)